MVQQFPVADSLHLLHLGIMKRLLFGWRDGTFRKSDTKWPAQTTKKVSEYLTRCKLPAEFVRVLRDLECMAKWKGTEYRTVLQYVGIVALKDHLTTEAYEHFLLLFCSVTVCTSKHYFEMLPVARAMLLQYIELFAEIYGEQYMTSNVHNLVHLVDDVEYLGELDSFSAYVFESMLGKIKRLLRNGNRPLAQVAKRLIEDTNCTMSSSATDKINSDSTRGKAITSKRNGGENIPDALKSSMEVEATDNGLAFYSKIELGEFRLATDSVNCWFLTKNDAIVCLTNIIRNSNNEIRLCCVEAKEKRNFFKIPIESRHLNIYCAYIGGGNFTEMKLLDLFDVKCKLVQLNYHDLNVFVPLLHTKQANFDENE